MSSPSLDPARWDGRPTRDARYWRTIAERYGGMPATGEFPPEAESRPEAWSRRQFLALLGASMALAGTAGCSSPHDADLIPYVHQPLDVHIDHPSHYATAMTLAGHGTGLIVTAREGRPIKIDGNPLHPASLGGCGVWEQASLLQLYDPDRAQVARSSHGPCLWNAGLTELASRCGGSGAGLRIVMEPTSSWCIRSQMAALHARWPEARVIIHDPSAGATRSPSEQACMALFGQPLMLRLDLSRAAIVVAIDADVLAEGPGHLAHAREFSSLRRRRMRGADMNRLYAAEASPSCTGSIADHRFRIDETAILDLLIALMAELSDVHGVRFPAAQLLTRSPGLLTDRRPDWVRAAAADLAGHRGSGLVLIGPRQPPLLHGIGMLLNDALGNAGSTVSYSPDVRLAGDCTQADLASELASGRVDDLLILGGNPVATSPGDLPFAALIGQARHRWYLGTYEDETAAACEHFIPHAHFLESWGDTRAFDGTSSIQQPLIAPLLGGITPIALIAGLLGERGSDYDLVRRSWRRRFAGSDIDFDGHFREVLRRGCEADGALAAIQRPADWPALLRLAVPAGGPGGYCLSLRLDPKVHDGRFANNPWLQELPDPISTLTWDNAALISPAAARELKVSQGDLIDLRVRSATLTVPVMIQPGQADRTITVSLGYGRRGNERTACGIGADAYGMRTQEQPWLAAIDAISRRTGSRELAVTQHHWSMEGRPVIRESTLAEFNAAAPTAGEAPSAPSLRSGPMPTAGRQWGMVIDLSVCIGCNACVIACQAENNIPVVGRDNVLRSREMHWLRVDRYYRGDGDDPAALMQPMACQHCEKAPCEYVCPTYATTHSHDGLNEMTYNRCVGTRFCSNNCPYKVRRFNWYNFNDGRDPLLAMASNPEVTVRDRGVMEKCTYCVQRIRTAEHAAIATEVPLRSDGIVTACQQTCPTQAIVFGDINDPDSDVTAARAHPLAYGVLDDTGSQPRTRYLARLRNPHPLLP